MQTRLAANYGGFSVVRRELVRPRAVPYPSIDDDTVVLMLALIGMTLMAIATASTLVAFSIF
jgi:hypothetical protein